MVLIALDAGAVDLDLDNVGVDAVDSGAESFVEHGVKIPASRTERERRGGRGHKVLMCQIPTLRIRGSVGCDGCHQRLWKTGPRRQAASAAKCRIGVRPGYGTPEYYPP